MTDMDDLATWLRAQLDEEERVAREATPSPWQAKPATESAYAEQSALVVRTDVPLKAPWSSSWVSPWVVEPDSEGSEGINPADAEHIACWNPARVLAEVDAKRRIIDRHEDALARRDDHDYSSPTAHVQAEEYRDWVLPLLALPYADRPGYQEEWRP